MSLGKGIGQYTGGDQYADAAEFRDILKMICEAGRGKCSGYLTDKEVNFIDESVGRSNTFVTHFRVTGKQLFWLRDIKDKLVDAGVL